MTDDPQRAELDELLNTLLPLAEQHLANYGEFFPFAAAIGSDGKSRLVNAFWGDEHPSSDEVIARLISILREGAAKGEYQAVGICFNGTLRDESRDTPEDAVIVRLGQRRGSCAQVAMPYRRNTDGSYDFGELIAMRDEPFAFQDE